MKTMMIVLATLMSLSAHAQVGGLKKTLECSTNSDPDYVNVDFYRVGNRIFLEIMEVAGDGDDGGYDVVEVKLAETTDNAFRTYKQVPTTSIPAALKKNKPNGKVRGAVLRVPAIGSEAYIRATRGPISPGKWGNALLECKRVNIGQ